MLDTTKTNFSANYNMQFQVGSTPIIMDNIFEVSLCDPWVAWTDFTTPNVYQETAAQTWVVWLPSSFLNAKVTTVDFDCFAGGDLVDSTDSVYTGNWIREDSVNGWEVDTSVLGS
jgi:hypothetical protein